MKNYLIIFTNEILKQRMTVGTIIAKGDAFICANALNKATTTEGVTYSIEEITVSK